MTAALQIIPAIDLKDGRCVRLRQGAADQAIVYDDDPPAVARRWINQGAPALHIVDLDGAFAGCPMHTSIIRAIIAAAGKIPVQVGGGLRSDDDLQTLLDAGAARVIIGTRAINDTAELGRLAKKFGQRLAVGIDARNGIVQVKGWTEASSLTPTALAQRAAAAGIGTLIYTDIATDGMLQGPNFTAVAAFCKSTPCQVIASGGVATPDDISRFRDLRLPNLIGVIVGKALYAQTTTLPALLAAARNA